MVTLTARHQASLPLSAEEDDERWEHTIARAHLRPGDLRHRCVRAPRPSTAVTSARSEAVHVRGGLHEPT